MVRMFRRTRNFINGCRVATSDVPKTAAGNLSNQTRRLCQFKGEKKSALTISCAAEGGRAAAAGRRHMIIAPVAC